MPRGTTDRKADPAPNASAKGRSPAFAALTPEAARRLIEKAGLDPSLAAECEKRLAQGLLPYGGRWRTPEEIAALHRKLRARSWVVLVNVVLVLAAVGFVDFVLGLIVVKGLG